MTIKRNHPKYEVRIDPEDEMINGKTFGDVPFTQTTFSFNYSDEVKEEDIPMAFVKTFHVKLDTVMEAWDDN